MQVSRGEQSSLIILLLFVKCKGPCKKLIFSLQNYYTFPLLLMSEEKIAL